MEQQVTVVQRASVQTLGYAVTDYIKLGWEIYGPPFILNNSPSQIVIKTGKSPPVEPVEYQLVTGSSAALQAEILGMLLDGWKLHSNLIVFQNLPSQAMLMGPVSVYAAGQAPNLDALIARMQAAEDSIATTTTSVTANSSAIENLTEAVSAQTAKFNTVDGAMLGKANLVNGKVPYSELPEFPVGRKVTVANQAARLALSTHTDLTIAYEQDTADAWALNPNADPSVSGNWSKLGNAQATGVITFNGRAGNIAPQANDYITNQIAETPEKRFVSTEQINLWNSAPNPGLIDTKLAEQKTANDSLYETKQHASSTYALKTDIVAPPDLSGYVLKSVINEANGIAPLDANKRVALANLPTFLPQRARQWRDVKASRNVSTNYNNTSGNDLHVHFRSTSSNSVDRYLRCAVYNLPNAGGTSFVLRSDAMSAAGNRWLHLNVVVPAGGSYTITGDGGTTNATIETWYEMS